MFRQQEKAPDKGRREGVGNQKIPGTKRGWWEKGWNFYEECKNKLYKKIIQAAASAKIAKYQKRKQQKIKKKYGDADEEETALRLQILGSRGKKFRIFRFSFSLQSFLFLSFRKARSKRIWNWKEKSRRKVAEIWKTGKFRKVWAGTSGKVPEEGGKEKGFGWWKWEGRGRACQPRRFWWWVLESFLRLFP